jgi:hypothetical protein
MSPLGRPAGAAGVIPSDLVAGLAGEGRGKGARVARGRFGSTLGVGRPGAARPTEGGRRLPLRPSLRRGRRSCWAVRGSGGCGRGLWWRVRARMAVRWLGGGVHRGRPWRRGGSPLCRPARARPCVGRRGYLNRRQGREDAAPGLRHVDSPAITPSVPCRPR